MASLTLRVITPERIVLDTTVRQLKFPAIDGSMGVLPRHAAMVAALDAAELSEPTLKNRQRVVVQRGLRRRQIRHPQAAGLTHQFAHRPPASWGA